MASMTGGRSEDVELDNQSLRSRPSYTSSYLAETSRRGAVNGLPILPNDVQSCERAIINIISGQASAVSTPLNDYSNLYLQLLRHRVLRFSHSQLGRAVFPSDATDLVLYQALVIISRGLETGTATIDTIARELLELMGFQTITHELYQFVFRGISLISLLFDAEENPSPSPARFRMVLLMHKTRQISSRHQQSSIWRRLTCPITDESGGNVHIDLDQLLSHFGQFVPTPCVPPLPVARRDFYEDTLVASNLNYYTISKIGGLRIEWVESLSLHLDLYERTAVLRLFAYPSFCALLCEQFEKQETFLSKIVSVGDKVTEMRGVEQAVLEYAYSYDFLLEVLCSYRLIFGQHKASYTRFNSIRPSQVVDPLLIRLGGSSYQSHHFYSEFEAGEPKTMYTASADFPLLGQRLLKLQNYMNERNPSDLRTLWYDRRDILRFYTFWAVVVVGAIGLVLSATSVALTAVQVRQGIANNSSSSSQT